MATTTLKARINQALKEALLAHDSFTATALRGLKSAIQYVEVAEHKREAGLSDAEIQTVLAKEAKKRQESADFYVQGGSPDRAANELREKALTESFLPAQLTNEALQTMVDAVVAANPAVQLGQVIGLVKQQAGAEADGARIAAMVRARMTT